VFLNFVVSDDKTKAIKAFWFPTGRKTTARKEENMYPILWFSIITRKCSEKYINVPFNLVWNNYH